MIGLVLKLSATFVTWYQQTIRQLPQAAAVLLGIALFWVMKEPLGALQNPDYTYALVPGALIALLGFNISVSKLSVSYRIIYRVMIGMLFFYSFTAGFSALPEVLNAGRNELTQWGISNAHIVLIVAGILAFWRVGFGAYVVLHTMWEKALMSDVLQTGIQTTDYLNLAQGILFMVLATLVAQYLPYIIRNMPKLVADEDRATRERDYLSYSQTIMMAMFAIHFVNYFTSGVMKIRLSNPWWEWLITNDTSAIMMAADLAHLNPLLTFPWLLAPLYWLMENGFVVFNVLVLGGQLLSIVALRNFRAALVLTIFFDLMHTMIFFATGIFFWKWILANLAFVTALSAMTHKRLTWPAYGFFLAIFLGAKFVFHVVWLGWFDTHSSVDIHFEAVTETGEVYRVPSNYFLGGSVQVSQQRMGRPAGQYGSIAGHFPTMTLGSVYNTAFHHLDDKCGLPRQKPIPLTDQPNVRKANHIVSVIHPYILSQVDENGRLNYDLYPHHIWSNVFMFDDFKQLDKRTISYYRYVVESVCTKLKEGRAERNVVYRSTLDIPVK